MAVRIRFAMHGKTHQRVLHLVAIDQRKRRNAKPIETLGKLNPRLEEGQDTKTVEWSVDRIKYWLGVGAQPTKSVERLFRLGGILPPPEGSPNTSPSPAASSVSATEATQRDSASSSATPSSSA
ncbi:ribosomal protein S16 [Obba rivulosa]|uniref:Ribosomal protein S16 n=1 Tax=Obba rivulosa TaxID=1052685 RepID=A0A8E2DSA4_9APHY|nr:ribosomal protein S16 [Obba rivulosa]